MKLIQLVVLVGFCLSAAGQGLVTLVQEGVPNVVVTNTLTIDEHQSATVTMLRGNGSLWINKGSAFWHVTVNDLNPNFSSYVEHFIIVGPAQFDLVEETGDTTDSVWLTLDIQPAQYPPDKAAVIGPHSGPMHVTMETSTDLINWGTATNDITYPDSEEARFFRIKLEKDVGQ